MGHSIRGFKMWRKRSGENPHEGPYVRKHKRMVKGQCAKCRRGDHGGCSSHNCQCKCRVRPR
jgi:hypothetical protein